MLIDSHCHIDGESFDADRDEVVQRARDAGVSAMLNVGTGDPHSDDFRRAVAVAESYENVWASVGVHPHDAKLYDDTAESHLIDIATNSSKVIAWGEIGLDHYYDHSPRDIQSNVFRRQIQTAKRLGLPIIIHSRDADDETVEMLAEEFPLRGDGSANNVFENLSSEPTSSSHEQESPGVMHCFGGTAKMAAECLELGFYISFAGNVTFKKAENLREAAAVVPIERMLVETDCPYLTPVPHRGKRNEPSMVVHTATFLSELKGIDPVEFAKKTTDNFYNLFRKASRSELGT